jgi:hypothetical protein
MNNNFILKKHSNFYESIKLLYNLHIKKTTSINFAT